MAKHYLKPVFRLIAKTLLLLVTALPVLAIELTPYTASYDATINGWATTMHRSLQPTDNPQEWLLSNKASLLFAKVEEQSRLLSDGKSITSLHYQYSNNLKKSRNKTIQFDWAKKQAYTRKGEKQVSLPLPETAFDQLSYQEQLRLDILNNENFCEKTYTIIDTGKTKQYTVRAIGEEWLETKVGKLLTLKLEQTREGKDRRTEIWLAKDWQYLIVKLQRFEDGKSDQLLELKEAVIGENPVSADKQDK